MSASLFNQLHDTLSNRRGKLKLLALAGTFSVTAAAAVAPACADPVMTPDLAARVGTVLRSVVNVKATSAKDGTPFYAWGSGFVVSAAGVIVTNRHVIQGPGRITVSGPDIERTPATVLYVSTLLDLAFLKIETDHPLPVLPWADSDTLRIGDTVLAIGNPLGIGTSVSAGIVSALHRNINEGGSDDFIQTDAAINHGNSGGPLIDTNGAVVGLDTALYSSPNNTGSIGLGFALTANDVKFVTDQVLQFGRERSGWLGVHLQTLSPDLAQGFGVATRRAVLVSAVDAGGPAATAGLREGDIILSIDGHEARAERQIQRVIAQIPPGRTVALQMLRGGAPLAVQAAVAEFPAEMEAAAKAAMSHPMMGRVMMFGPDHLGMDLTELTQALRDRHKFPAGVTGVFVASIDPLGAASDSGIIAGDLIVRIRDTAVATPGALVAQLREMTEQKLEQAPLLVLGTGGPRWVSLQIGAAD